MPENTNRSPRPDTAGLRLTLEIARVSLPSRIDRGNPAGHSAQYYVRRLLTCPEIESMKVHLFYTLLVIFAATALVTLLGITGVVHIADGYLTALVTAFLIESAGAVLALFRRAEFFPESQAEQAHSEDQLREQHATEMALLAERHARQIDQLAHAHAKKHESDLKIIGNLRQANAEARGLFRRITPAIPRSFRSYEQPTANA